MFQSNKSISFALQYGIISCIVIPDSQQNAKNFINNFNIKLICFLSTSITIIYKFDNPKYILFIDGINIPPTDA